MNLKEKVFLCNKETLRHGEDNTRTLIAWLEDRMLSPHKDHTSISLQCVTKNSFYTKKLFSILIPQMPLAPASFPWYNIPISHCHDSLIPPSIFHMLQANHHSYIIVLSYQTSITKALLLFLQ